jgi:hypothetical protein
MQLSAAPLAFVGTSGVRKAEVTFAMQGTNLIVTLTNEATVDQDVPTDILTAVFFSLDGLPGLTGVSGVLTPGSTVVCGAGVASCGQPLDNVVGGEWA